MGCRSEFASKPLLLFLLFVCAWVVSAHSVAAQNCPSDLCFCLGNAATNAVVASDVSAKSSRIRYSGSTYPIGASVDGNLCSTKATLAGVEDGEGDFGGDAAFTAPAGKSAVKFKGYRVNDQPVASNFIAGVLATGGGKVANPLYASALGGTDTTGSHPAVAPCRAAQARITTASAEMAGLPGVSLGDVIVGPGETRTLQAGQGVTVFRANSLVLKSGRDADGDLLGATLRFEIIPPTPGPSPTPADPNNPFDPNDPNDPNNPTPPLSEPLILLNVAGGVSIGSGSQVVSGLTASPEQILVHVYGPKAGVSIGKLAVVEPPILAPAAVVKVNSESEVGNLFARKVALKGAVVSDALLCE